MIWMWLGFVALVLGILALDLGAFHRRAHVVGIREALVWSTVWMSLAAVFAGFIFLAYRHHWGGLGRGLDAVDGRPHDGPSAALKFLTAYVLEKSLSIDNVFVISLIFSTLSVPLAYQHRVLFWGIIGALLLRAAMIGLGAELIFRYHWILYGFGIFLILTAARMLVRRKERSDPSRSLLVRLTRRILPVTPDFHGARLLVPAAAAGRAQKKRVFAYALTPLAVALIAIEAADALFAVDSIPAVFGVTGDPFLVFTSNIFAVLGLRSLYFVLAGLVARFRHLHVALAVVLGVVGAKMLLASWLEAWLGPGVDRWLLGLILAILVAGILTSRGPPRGRAKRRRGPA